MRVDMSKGIGRASEIIRNYRFSMSNGEWVPSTVILMSDLADRSARSMRMPLGA